jgi:hypothetical protein
MHPRIVSLAKFPPLLIGTTGIVSLTQKTDFLEKCGSLMQIEG